MKYLITESKAEQMVLKYLDTLIDVDNLEILQHPLFDYKFIYKQNRIPVILIDEKQEVILFDKDTIWEPLQEFFNLNQGQMTKFTRKWAEKNLKVVNYLPRSSSKLMDFYFYGWQ